MSRTFVLWDLAGNQIGQIERAWERRVALPKNGMSAASCHLHLRDSLGRELLDRKGKAFLGVYRGSTLEFVGDCTMAVLETRSKEGKPPGIACNFGGPMWRLTKRRTGKTDFTTTPPNTALLIAPQDVGTTISQLIQVANSESDTGIRTGTITPTVTAGYGPVGYKQLAEAISELADIKVFPLETPTWSISDDFPEAAAGLDTQGFNTGAGTWGGTGNPSQFATDGAGVAYRSAVTDESLDRGRWAIAHTTTFTNVIVQADVKFSGGPIDAKLGVFARRSGTFLGGDECWIMATIDPVATSQVTVRKCVNGVYTTISQSTLPALAAVFFPLRLQVQDDGQYFVWASNIGSLSETMLAKGHDADLATGGALATGTTGMYDVYLGAAANTRTYDNFRVGVPSSTPTLLGLEYELVPSVPTLDTNQSGVVGDGIKIATLNIAPRIGSDTTTVFEWGDGNSSMEHFRWVVDRGLQMNRGYSLPPDFNPGAGGWDVKQSSDLTSMAHPLDGGYGWYEDVVGDKDFSDAGLRQADVDEHVRIRGEPREVITFEPSPGGGPAFGTDYAVGDTVIGRAQDDGVELFNAQLRVDSVEITIDENGREVVVPNLIPGE